MAGAGCIILLLFLIMPTGAGNTVTITGQVVEPSPPVADFTANQTQGYAPLTVQFTNLSGGFPTAWEWDFETDGVIDAATPDPSHTYTLPGSYSVSLTVRNAGGSDTLTRPHYIVVLEPDPAARIEDLRDYIEGLPIPRWAEWFLISPLERALDQLDRGHDRQAINQMRVFLQFVNHLHRFHVLTDEQAGYLIEEATEIIGMLQE
jgi:PKD repeat protein